MSNLAFALTDFLVVIGAGLGIYRLWPDRRNGKVRMIRLGLALMGLAALVGTVRFAAGLVSELADIHSMTSRFAAAAGLMLIAIAPALKLAVPKLDVGLARYIRYGIPVLAAAFVLFPGLGGIADAMPVLALLVGFGASGWMLLRGSRQAGAMWLGSFALLAFASLAIGGSRTETTLGVTNWHLYHALLGIWAVSVGEATRRLFRPRS